MILVDTSVWIDVLSDRDSPAISAFEAALRDGPPLVGDLVLVELLQGIRDSRSLRLAQTALSQFDVVTLCGSDIAHKAAANYRTLRRRGVTVRGTIDVIIGTWCIENGAALLHQDRDFLVMEDALGLVAFHGA